MFLLLKNQGHVGVYRGIYISAANSKHFHFKLFLFHWSDHIWSLWSYLPAETTGDQVTPFSTIRCWRKFFTSCRTKSQMVWNHSDNKNIRKRTTSFSQSGSSWVESDHRCVVVFKSSILHFFPHDFSHFTSWRLEQMNDAAWTQI